jgi:hypothetical protein
MKPNSMVVCSACNLQCQRGRTTVYHEVRIFRHCHILSLYIGYILCWFQLVLTACCISRQLRQMRQPRKVTTRKPSPAATRILVTTMMEIIFLRHLCSLESKRQDLVDFVVRSASFAELALHVNFIITVINEDICEKLGSFLKQALQSSASDATVINTKSQRLIRPKKSSSFRYYKIYPIIPMNPDPIRC